VTSDLGAKCSFDPFHESESLRRLPFFALLSIGLSFCPPPDFSLQADIIPSAENSRLCPFPANLILLEKPSWPPSKFFPITFAALVCIVISPIASKKLIFSTIFFPLRLTLRNGAANCSRLVSPQSHNVVLPV